MTDNHQAPLPFPSSPGSPAPQELQLSPGDVVQLTEFTMVDPTTQVHILAAQPTRGWQSPPGTAFLTMFLGQLPIIPGPQFHEEVRRLCPLLLGHLGWIPSPIVSELGIYIDSLEEALQEHELDLPEMPPLLQHLRNMDAPSQVQEMLPLEPPPPPAPETVPDPPASEPPSE